MTPASWIVAKSAEGSNCWFSFRTSWGLMEAMASGPTGTAQSPGRGGIGSNMRWAEAVVLSAGRKSAPRRSGGRSEGGGPAASRKYAYWCGASCSPSRS
jgi:hypothetical protein